VEDKKVAVFDEKPATLAGRINGGFMVFDGQRIWDYLDASDDQIFEREPLAKMAQAGQLGCYEHDGSCNAWTRHANIRC